MPTRRHVLCLAGLRRDVRRRRRRWLRTRSRWSRPSRSSATWCSNVGGDRVEVAALVGPNSDAHVFSPTPADAKKLAAAKVVFVNGLGLEGWMTRLVSASGSQGARPVVASTGIKTAQDGGRSSPGRMVTDPHAWQSIANAKIYVANIRDGLSKADPRRQERL